MSETATREEVLLACRRVLGARAAYRGHDRIAVKLG